MEEHEDYIFCYIGRTKGLYGVGFLIKKKFKKNIHNFKGISERIALLQLKFEKCSLSIIQAYAPTERSTEEEIDNFYEELEVAHELADKKVIVMGDFNAKIGSYKTNIYPIMGRHSFGEPNERGDRLINYALQHKLSIMNTFFKKKLSHRWTWRSPDQKIRNEIDFIMINNYKQITNLEILSNIHFPSDHRLVRATVLLRNPPKSRKNFSTLPKFPTTEIEIIEYKKNLETNLGTKHFNLADTQSYYNFIEKNISASLQLKDVDQVKEHKIFTGHTIQLINRRTELIHTKQKTRKIKAELSIIYKKTYRSIRKDYHNHRQEVITRNINKFRSPKRAYKELSTHKLWIQELVQNSVTTNSRTDVIEHATNFYKKLYRKRSCSDNEIQTNNYNGFENITPIEYSEVYEQIKRLKDGKSPGPDGLYNEVLSLGALILTPHLTRLFNMIIDTETIPEQWRTSDIILLFKKGNPADVGNYRPISLLSSIYKLFSSILLKRITQSIDKTQPREQAGFRSGFSTMDHIHTVEQIIEKCREFNRPLYVAFIDYSKAFDSVSHCSIWNALHYSGVNQKYINILKCIYANSTSRIKLETRGDEIKIERGVRQGDPLSPKLFIAVLESIFRKLNWSNQGLLVDGEYLNHLRFADDIAVIAETPRIIENMMKQLDHYSSKIGLEMNQHKTKILTNSYKYPIIIRGNNIEYVDDYIYLGKQISFKKTNNEDEVSRRINATWKKFWTWKEILKGNYELRLKKVVFDTCLLPCLLYGCETWTFTNKVKQKIRCAQTAMERSMLKIRKIQKIKNEHIRQKTKITDALKHTLTLKWRWAGHISRYTDKRWTIQTTRWKGPSGKRNIGRPKRRWADDITQIAGKDWLKLSKDRDSWRRLEEAFTQNGVHISKLTNH